MSGAGLIFLGIVSILFMALGILGICKKVKFSKSIRGMYKLTGRLAEYNVVPTHDEEDEDDDFILDMFFPIYEYEWKGEERRAYSTNGVLGYQCHTRGKRVRILMDPQTEKVTCLDAKKPYESILLTFGVIGVFVFIVTLMLGTGRLP